MIQKFQKFLHMSKIYDFNKKYIWEILLDNAFQLHFILNRLINRLKLKKIEI